MPLLTSVLIRKSGNTDVAQTTLDGADTFVVNQTLSQSLILENSTGASVTVTIIGDQSPVSYFCHGVGMTPIAAESVTIPDGQSVSVYLSSLRIKLAGTATITGGTGLKASLVEY